MHDDTSWSVIRSLLSSAREKFEPALRYTVLGGSENGKHRQTHALSPGASSYGFLFPPKLRDLCVSDEVIVLKGEAYLRCVRVCKYLYLLVYYFTSSLHIYRHMEVILDRTTASQVCMQRQKMTRFFA